MAKTYKELIVWQKSVSLASKVYEITANFPSNQTFSLSSQMQRSAISIASNVAEGFARGNDKEFCRYLKFSYASLCELETQIIIAFNAKFINKELFTDLENATTEISKMICSFIDKLKLDIRKKANS
jgi:four helix bundle protein